MYTEDAIMAKASQPDHGDVDTGIYRRRRVALKHSDRPLTEHELANATAALNEFVGAPESLGTKLGEIQEWLKAVSECDDEFLARDARSANSDLMGMCTMLGMVAREAGSESQTYGTCERLVEWALRLAQTSEQINICAGGCEEYVKAERGRRENRDPDAGAKLTRGQWSEVERFIRSRVKTGMSDAAACDEAAVQLLTATLPGLEGTSIDIAPKTLRNRWSRRNERPGF
jgi:hypothetical protein